MYLYIYIYIYIYRKTWCNSLLRAWTFQVSTNRSEQSSGQIKDVMCAQHTLNPWPLLAFRARIISYKSVAMQISQNWLLSLLLLKIQGMIHTKTRGKKVHTSMFDNVDQFHGLRGTIGLCYMPSSGMSALDPPIKIQRIDVGFADHESDQRQRIFVYELFCF